MFEFDIGVNYHSSNLLEFLNLKSDKADLLLDAKIKSKTCV